MPNSYDGMSTENRRVIDSLAGELGRALHAGGFATAEGEIWSRLRDAIATYVAESAEEAQERRKSK